MMGGSAGPSPPFLVFFRGFFFEGGGSAGSLQDGSAVPGRLAGWLDGLASGGGPCGCVALDPLGSLRVGRGGAAPIMPLLGVMGVWWMACGARWRGSLGISLGHRKDSCFATSRASVKERFCLSSGILWVFGHPCWSRVSRLQITVLLRHFLALPTWNMLQGGALSPQLHIGVIAWLFCPSPHC